MTHHWELGEQDDERGNEVEREVLVVVVSVVGRDEEPGQVSADAGVAGRWVVLVALSRRLHTSHSHQVTQECKNNREMQGRHGTRVT